LRFYSKYKGYKLWLKPSFYGFDPIGNRSFTQGVSVKFDDGWYETADQEIINMLKINKQFGVDFWSVDEPSAPNPMGVMEVKAVEKASEESLTDCPYCAKEFKNKRAVTAHVRFFHKKA
jgi:hypothetical protein